MSEPTSKRTISFGFLLLPLQSLDLVGPMDVLHNISHQYVSEILPLITPDFFPFSTDGLVESCPIIKCHHIAPTMEPVATSGNMHMQPTTTLAGCPKLDYLLIGGPRPDYSKNLPADIKAFILEQSKQVKAIFTTCTGGITLAATGLLDGIPATTNHVCIPMGQNLFPAVKWNDDQHWVVVRPDDEEVKSAGVDLRCEIWTGAGSIAGMDMIAEWIRTEFGRETGEKLLGYATSLLEWRPSDVQGKAMDYVDGRGQLITA